MQKKEGGRKGLEKIKMGMRRTLNKENKAGREMV